MAEGQFLIVGVGASAGGIEAFQTLLESTPPDSNLAYVLVLHLPPDGSHLPEILARHTPMRVREIEHGDIVEPNQVYVIRPAHYLRIKDGILQLQEPVGERVAKAPVDVFFRALATDRKERAACVILSGTGSNGSLGLREIKGQGGLTLVQDPEMAAFDGMPRSAIATGAVDRILPIEQIARVLVDFANHHYVVGEEPPTPRARRESDLEAIVEQLRTSTRYDYHHCKRGTLQRRIARRMGLRNIANTTQYRELLEENQVECRELSRDLLIRVTNFFRDRAAFEALKREVIPQLVADFKSGGTLRAWVPACATGEEAYSIAMLLHSELRSTRKDVDLKVFASDVDEESIEIARAAKYPDAIFEDVPEPFLEKYFVHEESGYRISKPLRECVVFAPQDVVDDPPFSKMNLVACRNLLIYLQPEVQRRVLSLLHFSLCEGGYLFLGAADSIGAQTDLFAPVAKRHRIFRRIGPKSRLQVDFPGGAWEPKALAEPSLEPSLGRAADATFAGWARKLIMEFYAPACVIVDREQRVLFFSGATDKYLLQPPGEPTRNLLDIARGELADVLGAAMFRVMNSDEPVQVSGELRQGGASEVVRITAVPLKSPREAEGLILISFEERRRLDLRDLPLKSPKATRELGEAGEAGEAGEKEYVLRLEHDLAAAQDNMHLNAERIADVLEAYQSANEEVRSMNEELQSINEELVTSKEELQSLNEELISVNQQLENKVQELEATNDDLGNLLRSTDLATLFLNRQFHIRRFTPAITRLVSLLPTDIGRPFSDLAPKFIDEDLLPHCEQVLADLVPLDKEIAGPENRWYLRTVLPYRTEEERIDGVVITFADITARKRAEAELEATNRRLVEDVTDMKRLQDVSLSMVRTGNLDKLLGDILVAAVVVMRSDMGTIQLFDAATNELVLRDHVGFDDETVAHWRRLNAGDGTVCGEALRLGRRVPIGDLTGTRFESTSAGGPANQAMVEAGVRAVQSSPLMSRDGRLMGMISTHYQRPHQFDDRELRLLDVLVRQAADLIDRANSAVALRQSEERLQAVNISLEHVVALRTRVVQLLQDVTVIANQADSVDGAVRRTLERVCSQFDWPVGHAWMLSEEGDYVDAGIWRLPDDGRCAAFAQATRTLRFRAGEGLLGDVTTQAQPKWIPNVMREPSFSRASHLSGCGIGSAVAFPVCVGERVVGAIEFFLSETAEQPEPELLAALAACGTQLGRVVEREQLEREIAFATANEQRLIGQELHDAVSQELTGIAMFTERLREELRQADAPQAADLDRLVPHLQSVQQQVRRISHGLMPVGVTPEGLMFALRRLAENEQTLCGLPCRFECPQEVLVADSTAATQLYRIAQEAVQNAAKHSQATFVTIELTQDDQGGVELIVRDNGRGVSREMANGEGLGLRIMQHRAALIGAQLVVYSPATGGTSVICALPRMKFIGDFPVSLIGRGNDDGSHR